MAALDAAHDESGQIVLARLCKGPGISAVSPPISAQPFSLQPRARPSTIWPRHIGVELAGGEVIQEEQRRGALHGDVVHAVVHQVLAHRVVAAGLNGDLQLGAHAVGRRHQHRLLPAAQTVAGAESADLGQDSARERVREPGS